MFVSCECCGLSGRGLCDWLITHPEESYRLWGSECDREAPKLEAMTRNKVEATKKNMLIINDHRGTIFNVKFRAVSMRLIISQLRKELFGIIAATQR